MTNIHYPSEIKNLPVNNRKDALTNYLIKGRPRQDSLELRISSGVSLTKKEIESIINLLTYRCNEKTKSVMAAVLNQVPDIQSYGIYGRILLENEQCSYCAGQDYVAEIKTVRKCLLGRR